MMNSARSAALALALCATASTVQASDIYGGAVIPPFEVVTAIRSMGLEPASNPVRRGPVYVIRAYEDGDPVRVTVDARSGRVLTVTEVIPGETARLGPAPMPPGSVPSVTYRTPPLDHAPPPAAAPPAVRQSAVTPRTPTPRARPAQAAKSETTASIPDGASKPGKSIPAPVAPSAALPSSSGAAPANETPAKTDTPLAPVAPLL